MSIIPIDVFENSNFGLGSVPNDHYTEDSMIKYKARSINLIKYNPNLFTNRSGAGFYDMVGGDKAAATTLAFGVLGLLYRRQANILRNVAPREGIWFNTFYFLYGASFGAFYSAAFFLKWQVMFNEYFAHFLIKRYKGSGELNNRNIYALKDHENTDECYVFTDSYINNFHM
jgi:hypothetical protein